MFRLMEVLALGYLLWALQDGKDALISWNPNLIYVQGGNTFWLYHCIEKGDWGADIVRACSGRDAAVYCGTSAGAIVMGASMDTACWKVGASRSFYCSSRYCHDLL